MPGPNDDLGSGDGAVGGSGGRNARKSVFRVGQTRFTVFHDTGAIDEEKFSPESEEDGQVGNGPASMSKLELQAQESVDKDVLDGMKEEDDLRAEGRYLFKWYVALQIISGIANGAVPALIDQLTDDMGFTLDQLGYLGSFVYIGIVVSSPIAGYCYSNCNSRIILALACWVNAGISMLVGLSWDPSSMIAFRSLSGLTVAFTMLWPNVWLDEFCPLGSHGAWMAALQGSAAGGVMLGYILSSVFVAIGSELGFNGWRGPFFMQASLMVPLGLRFFFVPNAHINVLPQFMGEEGDDTNNVESQIKIIQERKKAEKEAVAPASSSSPRKLRAARRATARRRMTQDRRGTIRVRAAMRKTVLKQAEASDGDFRRRRTRMKSVAAMAGAAIPVFDEESPKGKMCTLLTNPLYMCICFGISGLYFVVTGIQFWATDYFLKVLEGNPALVRMQFVFCSATGPVLGVVLGGKLIDKIGGVKTAANRARGLKYLAVIGGVAVAFALPLTYVENLWGAVTCMWFLLFAGGAVVPGATAMMYAIVSTEMKALAASTAQVIFNFFGYFMAPLLSGYVSAQSSQTAGFRVIMFYSLMPLVTLSSAAILAMRIAGREEGRGGKMTSPQGKDVRVKVDSGTRGPRAQSL